MVVSVGGVSVLIRQLSSETIIRDVWRFGSVIFLYLSAESS